MKSRNVYTVKQVNSYIKNMFVQDFMLSRIYVKGEVSNCKYHTSGHIYFSLKDESGTIACVMFAGSRAGLSFRIREGLQVIVLGSVSVYERDGKYQLYAREVIRDGAGLLYEKYEALKRELEEMGMFAQEYKQPIPEYVRTVGIVTAPTGAAVRDIIHIASRRNPYVQLLLYPALVQGEGAADSIVRGIRALEEKNPDVIIVGRGGGSIEDLWAFNEEKVARAVFDCRIPIISAVGHETDTTIIDYVADLRAPTPSAAAELAVYEYRNAKEKMAYFRETMQKTVLAKAQRERKRAEQAEARLRYLHPRQKLREKRQYAADLERMLRDHMEQKLQEDKHRLALLAGQMKGLSPLSRLESGYSYVADSRGKNIRKADQAEPGEILTIYVSDGKIRAEVISSEREDTVTGHGREEYENGNRKTDKP